LVPRHYLRPRAMALERWTPFLRFFCNLAGGGTMLRWNMAPCRPSPQPACTGLYTIPATERCYSVTLPQTQTAFVRPSCYALAFISEHAFCCSLHAVACRSWWRACSYSGGVLTTDLEQTGPTAFLDYTDSTPDILKVCLRWPVVQDLALRRGLDVRRH